MVSRHGYFLRSAMERAGWLAHGNVPMPSCALFDLRNSLCLSGLCFSCHAPAKHQSAMLWRRTRRTSSRRVDMLLLPPRACGGRACRFLACLGNVESLWTGLNDCDESQASETTRVGVGLPHCRLGNGGRGGAGLGSRQATGLSSRNYLDGLPQRLRGVLPAAGLWAL